MQGLRTSHLQSFPAGLQPCYTVISDGSVGCCSGPITTHFVYSRLHSSDLRILLRSSDGEEQYATEPDLHLQEDL